MSITMELSTFELEKEEDNVRGYVFINLNRLLEASYNEYTWYITENELKLSRKDKNKLGIHFITKKLISICSKDHTKKWFYYQINEKIENTLVKRIFNALPTNVTYGDGTFKTFLSERDYLTFTNVDASAVSFRKFRNFLKRYELQQLEAELMKNINIKLSLLP